MPRLAAPSAAAAAILLLAFPSAAQAQEAFAGVYAHGVDTPFTLYTGEGGVAVAAGVRFAPVEALSFIGSPQPYIAGSLNTRGDTSFAGAGLAWTIGKGRVYLRPGLGLVVHDGPEFRIEPASGRETDLGSRILFEPEIGLGYRVSDRFSLEAHWMHISHAQIFNSQQNPGIDLIGARVNIAL